MTWSLETSNGMESRKIAAFVVRYTRGHGLDLGCGGEKCWPHMIGVDSGHHFGQAAADIMVEDAACLPMFADNGLDFVFSSHLIEHMTDTRAALAEWFRVIKPGGHLVLYWPHPDHYPRIGQEGANPDHKFDLMPQDITNHMIEIAATGSGWALVEDETRFGTNEYSQFQVYRKTAEPGVCRYEIWQRNPEGKKRALVIRFGAIGDQIMAASILPLIKEQGFYISYMTTPIGYEVLERDSCIDEWLLQDKDQVPNLQLGPYIETLRARYDKLINLSESIEGTLLALPGRCNHSWTDEARRKVIGTVNYQERTHDLAGVRYRFMPRFYPSEAEREEALAFKASLGAPVILWALGGSSNHKLYPFADTVIAWLLEQTQAHVVLATGPDLADIEAGVVYALDRHGADLNRVHCTAGKWGIRRALCFAEYADVVVGPETGIINAASHLDTPTVVMLSHSSHENLTKHWRNTIVLQADPATTPCSPCHRLHFDWTYCAQVEETGGALCASNIKPELVFSAIRHWLRPQRVEAAAD